MFLIQIMIAHGMYTHLLFNWLIFKYCLITYKPLPWNNLRFYLGHSAWFITTASFIQLMCLAWWKHNETVLVLSMPILPINDVYLCELFYI